MRSTRRNGVWLVLALALMLCTAYPASADAALLARGCSKAKFIELRLSAVATVTSVRNMTCLQARRVVRRYGRSTRGETFRVGGRFTLGTFRCRVLRVGYEDATARCRRRSAVFRVGYGA
ncbi:MAG TPA: hypothetical protein VEX39_16365 [Thermoleophilaceae bacterium]|nr:hypothetical protein [Thermoleophilaceae bacterium]